MTPPPSFVARKIERPAEKKFVTSGDLLSNVRAAKKRWN
jgi:hypothetical protein